jgi:methyl-accepting chemotaxis protein
MPLTGLTRRSGVALSIRARLIALSAVWFTGLVLVLAGHFVGQRLVENARVESTRYRQLAEEAFVLRSSAADTRTALYVFLSTPSVQAETAAVSHLTETAAAMQRLSVALAGTPLATDESRSLASLIGGLPAALSRLVAIDREIGFDDRSGLRGAVSDASLAMTSEIRRLTNSGRSTDGVRLLAALTQIELARAEFALSQDDISLGNFAAAASRMDRVLDDALIPSEGSMAIRAHLAAYDAAFTSWTERAEQRLPVIDRILLTFDTAGLTAQSVADAARARATEAGAGLVATRLLVDSVLGVVLVVTAVAGILAAYVISRSIVGPLQRLGTSMTGLADGRLDAIAETHRRDEIGVMARALDVFRTNEGERRQLQNDSDRSAAARAERQERTERLIDAFRADVVGLLDRVSAHMDEMRATARALAALAGDTSTQIEAVATASATASSNVETVASASEELSASIAEIAEQIGRTSDVVREATDGARSTDLKISELAQAASRIGDVVSLIQAIAQQTNLLALNATIEAARAGDAGRGFAVVASEVKNLAGQTARATEEIAHQVAGIQAATGDAVEAIRLISHTMQEVNRYSAAISTAIEEQGSATAEISSNVAYASTGTGMVAVSIRDVTAAVGETTASASRVEDTSEEVARHAEVLRRTIDRFLDDVAAA